MEGKHRDCPFCGADESRLTVMVESHGSQIDVHVTCLDCLAAGPSVYLDEGPMEAEDIQDMLNNAEGWAWGRWDTDDDLSHWYEEVPF